MEWHHGGVTKCSLSMDGRMTCDVCGQDALTMAALNELPCRPTKPPHSVHFSAVPGRTFTAVCECGWQYEVQDDGDHSLIELNNAVNHHQQGSD